MEEAWYFFKNFIQFVIVYSYQKELPQYLIEPLESKAA